VVKGAYLLVHKRADSETHEKARSLWNDAQAAGANISHLMPFLSDSYSDFLKDVPE
jgi:predicted xylose isomerase-like sugar epimerase